MESSGRIPRFDLGGDYVDLHALLADLRREGPVVRVRCVEDPTWFVLDNDCLRVALADDEGFPPEASYSEMTDPAVGRSVMSMYGAEHTRNRAVVSPPFQRSRMARHREQMLEPVCQRLLDDLEGIEELDLQTDFARVLSMMVITSLIGMPADEWATLERWTNELFLFMAAPEVALRARSELSAFLLGVMEERREHPKDDLISDLVNGEFEGGKLSDEEILSFLRLLFPAGTHNTSNGIGSLCHAVLAQPGLQERLRAEPEAQRLAVEEMLRWEPPVANLPRRAGGQGAVLGGVEIPPHAAMMFSFAAANRDPEHFSEPDAFLLERDTSDALTFGFGRHFCLGARLAREEMAVALRALLGRTRHLTLIDPERTRPVGASLRGPRAPDEDHLGLAQQEESS